MARSASEDPRDVANLERLAAELRGVQAEAERQLALAEAARREAEAQQVRARDDRTEAARETRARRRQVGTGGTPTGRALEREPAVIDEGTAATQRATRAEQERTISVQRRIALEQRAAERVRAQAERDRSLPVLANRPGAGVLASQLTPAERIAAQGQLTQNRLASITAQREAERLRDQAIQFNNLRTQRLLGPGPVGGYGGGGGGGGRPPAPPGGPDDPGGPRDPRTNLAAIHANEEALKGLSTQQRAAYERAQNMSIAEGELSRNIAYNSRVIGLASNAYQKHGYLTSEFIQAAARGEVTFRELGTQVGGTIAKFAGWTAAAGAVYGALGAVNALGRGALDAAGGVALLDRVVTNRGGIGNDELQQRFADYARQFNLPIADVVQATYGATKAFQGDLPKALQATEQALFAVKVGELSAADSTRYLTAIVNGFQLDAADLPLLFDTINQAQNRFGGNTGAMVAGVAKAAGAFKLAGGTYRELIAILQQGSKLTGNTPVEVATAISRSASRVLTPQGVDALKKVGLDPSQNISQIYAQAAGEVQRAKKTLPEDEYRRRVQEIARALVPQGGQFARITAPILENRNLYDRIFAQLDPAKARGSAARELKRVFEDPREQIKRLGVDLERLGVTFGQLGGLALPGAFIKSLDLALDTTNRLLEVVNKLASLAGPFKPLVTGAIELAGALRLVRRFDLGGSLPRGGGAYEQFRQSIRRPEADRFRAQVFQGLNDERAFIEQERSRAAVTRGTTGVRRDLAGQALLTAQRSGVPEDIANAQLRYEGLQRQYQEAVDLEGAYRTQGVAVQRQINGLQARNLKSMEAIRTAMAAEGVLYYNPTLNRPTAGRPIASRIPFREQAPTRAADVLRYIDTVEGGTGVRGRASRFAGNVTAKAESALAALQARSSTAGPVIRAAGAATAAAGAGAGIAARGFGAAAAGIRAMYLALGPLEKGLLAAFVGYEAIVQPLKSSNKAYGNEADLLDRGSLKAAGKFEAPDFLDSAVHLSIRNTVRSAANFISDITPFTKTYDDYSEELAKHAQAEAASLAKAQSKGKLLYQPDIQANLKRRLAQAGNDTAAQEKAVQQALEEEASSHANILGTSRDRNVAKRITESIKAKLADLKAANGDLIAAIEAIQDAKGLEAFTGNTSAREGLYGPSRSTRQRYGYSIARARELLGQGKITTEEASGAISSAEQAAQQSLEQELSRRLSLAKGPGEANAARADFRQNLVAARLGPLRSEIARLQADSKKYPEHARANNQALAELRKGLNYESSQIEATLAESRRQSFDATEQVYDARTQLLATRSNDPVAALRIRLRRDQARLRAKAAEYGRNSAEYLSALNNAEEQRQQLVSAEIERYSARVDLNRARANIGADETARQAGALTDARNKLAYAQEHGASDSQLIDLQKAVYEAEGAISDQVKQRAEDILDAQRQLALSTLDPSNKVAADLVNIRYDRAALANAKTPAERIRARATLNTTQQSYRDDRISERADNIQFALTMDKIDASVAASQLEQLAKRVRNNKQLRRQLLADAHRLEQEAKGDSYALDISNIKLPTPYEVARAIKEGRSGTSQYRSQVTNQDNRTTIRIEVKDNNDLAKVGDVLDTHLQTGTRSALRAQGIL